MQPTLRCFYRWFRDFDGIKKKKMKKVTTRYEDDEGGNERDMDPTRRVYVLYTLLAPTLIVTTNIKGSLL